MNNNDNNNDDNDDNDDNILELMYIQYIYTFIYNEQIKVIQRNFRLFILKKKFIFFNHFYNMKNCLEDIIEFSYIPPNNDYLLLKNGGFHYREGLKSFNNCLKYYLKP